FLTKLLSYSVFVFLLYVVLGVAMLGFGAAGSLVALRPAWLSPERSATVLAWAALGFVAALFGSLAVFVRSTQMMHGFGFFAFAASGLLALPFFAGGLVITV